MSLLSVTAAMSARINRYIVGCKFRKLLDIKDQEQELIDT